MPPYVAVTTSKAQAKSDVWNVESFRSLLERKSNDSAPWKKVCVKTIESMHAIPMHQHGLES